MQLQYVNKHIQACLNRSFIARLGSRPPSGARFVNLVLIHAKRNLLSVACINYTAFLSVRVPSRLKVDAATEVQV